MNYIKNDVGDVFDFPCDYKQVWQNQFTLKINQPEIIKMRNSEVINDRDMKFINFLFDFTFATANQLFKFIGEEEKSSLKKRLDKLVQYRILNKFMLCDLPVNDIEDDSLQIYCLDMGGKYLIDSYSEKDTSTWTTTINMKASQVVSRYLVTASFYIELLKQCPQKIEYFKCKPKIRILSEAFSPSFEFCLKDNFIKKYFVCDVVRYEDTPILFRERADKYNTLLSTESWRTYYGGTDTDTPPYLFLITNSDNIALECAVMVEQLFNKPPILRITTDKRIQRGLAEKGVFMTYNEEKKSLQSKRLQVFDV